MCSAAERHKLRRVLLVETASMVCRPRLQVVHLAPSVEVCADCKHVICTRTRCGAPLTKAEHAEMATMTRLEHWQQKSGVGAPETRASQPLCN